MVADSTNTGVELAVTTASGGSTNLHDFATSGNGPSSFLAIGNSVYFLSGSTASNALWTSDGTVQGTQQVTFSDPNDTNSTVVANPTDVGGTLYFTSTNSFLQPLAGYGPDLWASPPGTTAPTLVAANLTSTAGNTVTDLTAVGNGLYFTVSTTGLNAVTNGLWQSNGTPGQAGPVTYTDPTTHLSTAITNVSQITDFNGALYYVSSKNISAPVLDTFDLATVPQAVLTLPFQQTLSHFTVVGPDLFFVASGSSGGRQLWVTDGATGGTQELTDVNSSTAAHPPPT